MGKKRNPSQKWGGGGFNAIPHRVLESSKFANLSPQATKLLVDLVSQYRGFNNGDLCAAMTLMQVRGWKSNAGLATAIKELRDTRFLVLTRQGGKHKPNLYALSFYAINDCKDERGFSKFDPHLQIIPSDAPRNEWLRDTPAPDLQEAKKRKKRADVVELKAHLQANPDDRYAENYHKGIAAMQRQVN